MLDSLEFDKRLMMLVHRGEYVEALAMLHDARTEAESSGDTHSLGLVVDQFVWFYSLKQPPDFEKVEEYSRELEKLILTGYSKLQTAMRRYWSMRDPMKAFLKAEEAIAAAQQEGDTRTEYQALGLIGLVLLDLKKPREAEKVLQRIEQMVAERGSFVIGDETLFLERLAENGLHRHRVQELARTLEPFCRDPEFRARLAKLNS